MMKQKESAITSQNHEGFNNFLQNFTVDYNQNHSAVWNTYTGKSGSEKTSPMLHNAKPVPCEQ